MGIDHLIYAFENRLKLEDKCVGNEKKIKHYRSSQKILLVGEGDFSFSVCLANAFGNAVNMVATSLDSEDELVAKYADAKGNLDILKAKACTILHKVDAHTLSSHAALINRRFDRIVFNFPHYRFWISREHDRLQIECHQDLVRSFMKNAKKLLSYMGEIHITHKTAYPFNQWNITDLAEEAGLEFVDENPFYKWEYPGYHNKKGEGHGSNCDLSFPVGTCSTYMFSIY